MLSQNLQKSIIDHINKVLTSKTLQEDFVETKSSLQSVLEHIESTFTTSSHIRGNSKEWNSLSSKEQLSLIQSHTDYINEIYQQKICNFCS